MKYKKVKTYLFNLFLEVPAILIAVLLALILTEKAEDLSRKSKANIVLESITNEVKTNYGRVVFIDSITSITINNNIKQIELYKKDSTSSINLGFLTTEISNVAWEMAKYSEVFSEINPNTLKAIGSIYQEQERVSVIYKNADLFNINKDPYISEIDNAILTTRYLESLHNRYKDLIGRYETFLGIKR